MKKKIIVIENDKQEKILKEALKEFKWNRNFNIKNNPNGKDKEQRIDDVYETEKLEKQLEK